MKKIFGILLALLFMDADVYGGCQHDLSEGMMYEENGFHFVVTSVRPYESEVSASTSSWAGIYYAGSYCLNPVYSGAKSSGDIVVPANSSSALSGDNKNYTTVGIGADAFRGCTGLVSVSIPNTVTYIGTSAFNGCSQLTEFVVPDAITQIADSAFYGCTYLRNVEFGNGVITLGNGIFKGCYSLRSVTFKGAVPYGLSASQFSECVNLETIYVPCNKINLFRNALGNNFNIVTESPYHYNITSSMPNAGSVNVSDFDCSSNSITISASPNPGWEFSSWSDGNTTNPRTIVLTSDVSLSASFIPEGHHFVYSLDLTSQATSISDWTIMDATLNSSYTDEAVGKYAFDVYGGFESESYVTSNPDISFKYRNSNDKQKAFCIYPGNCFEFNGKSGILSIKNTLAGDRILITCAAKGSMMASFADDIGVYPRNAIAITEDLTLPAKGSSSGADEQGYTWREIEFESLGGDVEIKEVNAGYRVKKVEVIRSNNYTVTANASPWDAGTVEVTYNADYSQATLTAMPNDGYQFTHWSDGSTANPRTIFLTNDMTLTANFVQETQPEIDTDESKEFWVTFLQADQGGADFSLDLAISSHYYCNVILSNPYTGWREQVTVQPDVTLTVNLDANAGGGKTNDARARQTASGALCYVFNSEQVDTCAIHVVSDHDISLIASNYQYASFDVTNVLPISSLQDEYIIQTYSPSDHGGSSLSQGSHFAIVATEDNTVVDYTLAANTQANNHLKGDIVTTDTLKAGQVWYVWTGKGKVKAAGDLSGTYVKARDGKKIAVFQGCPFTNIPYGVKLRDHIYSQAVPVKAWGDTFVLTATTGRKRDIYRVMASNDGTTVYLNGDSATTINAREYWEFELGEYYGTLPAPRVNGTSCVLTTSSPSAVHQFMVSQQYDGDSKNSGDPAMLWVSPVGQEIDQVTFSTCPGLKNSSVHNINIVTTNPTGITLDGIDISSEFQPVSGSSTHWFARHSLGSEAQSHTLQSSNGNFTAHVYGFAKNEGYAFTLGKVYYVPMRYTIQYRYDSKQGTVYGPESGIEGEEVTFYAVPNTGYHFKRWSDGNLDNPRYVELTQDTTFTALFELDVLEVTYIGMDGRVLGVESVQYGSQARQRGVDTDEFGYTLVGWSEDLSYVTTDMTVTAIYTRDAVNGFYYIYDKENRTAVLDREGNSYANIRTLNVPNNFIYRGIKFAVVAVGANAFENCDRLTEVVLPGNVENVEEYAFSGCSDMIHLTMSANLRGIADYAFNGCKRLEDITVYAQRIPDLTATSFNAIGNKKYVNVYVPDNRVNNYKRDEYWSEFNIVVKSADAVEGEVSDVTVEPEETTAQFTWPTDNSAGSYTIEITKDGVVFCTLIFNANGQLTGIAFAPGRNGNEAPMAAMTANGGMQFTVTGLDAGTSYAYTVTTKDTQERVIATFEGSFETSGSMEDGIMDVQSGAAPQKVLHNGQIYILRGEKVYTLQGVEVK